MVKSQYYYYYDYYYYFFYCNKKKGVLYSNNFRRLQDVLEINKCLLGCLLSLKATYLLAFTNGNTELEKRYPSEAYLKPCQTPMMELFCRNS